MTLRTTPHLNFRGTAAAALEAYRTIFGGELSITTYAQLGVPADAPGADAVVFGRLDADAVTILAYDVPGVADGDASITAGTTTRSNGATITDRTFFLSLQGESLDEVAGPFAALAAGGRVIEPLAASAWSAGFGMLTDRFGVTWVVDVAAG